MYYVKVQSLKLPTSMLKAAKLGIKYAKCKILLDNKSAETFTDLIQKSGGVMCQVE